MKTKLLIASLSLSVNVLAQQFSNVCGGYTQEILPPSMTCTNSSDAHMNKYRLQNQYIPGTNPYIDEIIIPVNIVVLADDYGNQGAFTEQKWNDIDPTFGIPYKDVVNIWINQAFQSTAYPSDPVSGYSGSYWLSNTNNTRIKVLINEVYFISNTSVLETPYSASISATQSLLFSMHPEAANFVNWYLIKNHINVSGAAGQAISGTYPKIISHGWSDPNDDLWTDNGNDYFYFNVHFPHELGHLLGIHHLYNESPHENHPGSLDFLEDVYFDPPFFPATCGDPFSSATDFCSNNLMGGKGMNWFISPLQAGRSHRNLRKGNIRHFAYGYSSLPHEVASNETWDFTFKSYNDIIVKSGAILTITCQLEMVKDSKIIIEPGAKLVIDGGVITSARSAGSDHEGWWEGIQVWGNPALSQTNPANQGVLITKNGAIIENAHEAIQVWKPDDWNSGGGIVDCRNTTFRNNWRSCAYYPYHFYNSTNTIEYPNKGIFRECEFIWDDNYMSTSVNCGISMYHVNGVSVQGCTFKDDRSGVISTRPTGITSYDAGYKVLGIDLNPGTYQNPNIDHYYDETDFVVSEFDNLKNGVEVRSGNTIFPVKVDHSKFENCETGVLVDAMDNVIVTRNKFDKNSGYHLQNPTMLQLVTRDATGYTVEGNIFTNTHNLGGSGTAIFDSGQENNEIYRNKFDGLSESNYASGFNSNDQPSAFNSKGLMWKCNEMNNAKFDLIDYVSSYSSVWDGEGVKAFQGTTSSSAGNLFSTNINAGNPLYDRHINQVDQDYLNYFFYSSGEEPTEIQGNVSVNAITSNTNTCASHFTTVAVGDGRLLTAERKFQINTDIDNLQNEITHKSSDLTSLLEQGNRQQLYDLIASIGLGNRQSVHNSLLSESPYLSQALLEELGEVDPVIYPHEWYKEVIIENIEVTYNPEFMDGLETKTYPMPSNLIEDILTARESVSTDRGEKEMEVMMLIEDLNYNENLLLKDELSDPDTIDWEGSTERVEDMRRELVNSQLINVHFSRGMVNEASDLLDIIDGYTGTYSLVRTKTDLEELTDYHRYVLSITNNTGIIQSLTVQQTDELRTMATTFQGKAARLAHNTLCFFAGECDRAVVIYDGKEGDDQKSGAFEMNTSVEERSLELGVYPNPNKGTFALVVPEECEIVGIKVVTFDGKEHLFETYPVKENEVDVELITPDNGMYLVHVTCKDGLVFTNRIVLQK